MEELNSDGEDVRGVGVSSGRRFASDSLRFTGVDMGNKERGLVRKGDYQDSEDEDDDSDSSEDEEFEQYLADLAVHDREEALVQSAMYRIERAKAKGRTDVDLNDEEIAALERRRKRDEAAKKKKSGTKKRKDSSRVAVPLTQLDPSSRKKKTPSARQSSSTSNLTEDQDRSSRTATGYFPPSTTAGRPRPGTTSAQRPQSRVRAPSTSRQPSDSSVVVRRGRNSSQAPLDPFQFQMQGSQAPSPAGSWRQFPGAQRGVGSRKGSKMSADNGSSEESGDSDENSEEDREDSVETTSSDDVGSGAQIVVEESSPEPSKPETTRRNPPRTSTSSSTSSKRKPAPTSTGRRKK